jgi:hypothetical protein
VLAVLLGHYCQLSSPPENSLLLVYEIGILIGRETSFVTLHEQVRLLVGLPSCMEEEGTVYEVSFRI